MSGIAGILKLGEPSAGERPVDHRLASRLAGLIGHRGCGEEGLYRAPGDKAVLACRRLAVTDLTEEGQMPLPNETGDMWVALDGEIWNHRALRHSLELEGHQFRSRSDAEVAVHAYERWGPDFLVHLQGMFALALWDDRRGRLMLARDRLGEKPLFYAEARGVLAFASEAAPLVEAMALPRRLDVRGLAQFLVHGLVMPPLTLFEGVRKLGPGEALMVEAAGMRRTAWWMPCRDSRKIMAVRALPAERHLVNLRALVESAVADRLAGEVPLGAILDGSAESVAVATVAQRLLGRPLDMVAALGPAAQAALPRDCRRLPLGDAEVGAFLAAQRFDEPLADPACVGLWHAARRLRDDGVPAALTGAGATALLPRAEARRGGMGLPRRLLGLAGRMAALVGGGPVPAAPAGEVALSPLLADAADEPSMADRIHAQAPSWLAADPGASDRWTALRSGIPERLMTALDRMAMAHGVEMRAPFLDDQVVDYALAIPAADRLPAGGSRALFEEMIGQPAPESPEPPAAEWFRGATGALFEGMLAEGRLFRDAILDGEACRGLLDAHRERRADHHRRLWAVLALAHWYQERDIEPPQPARPRAPALSQAAP